MSEYRTLLSSWPDWARLALICAFLPLFVLALISGYFHALWILAGPLMLAQVWMNRNTAEFGRTTKPWLFWGSLAVFSLMTLRGVLELYQKLAEVSL